MYKYEIGQVVYNALNIDHVVKVAVVDVKTVEGLAVYTLCKLADSPIADKAHGWSAVEAELFDTPEEAFALERKEEPVTRFGLEDTVYVRNGHGYVAKATVVGVTVTIGKKYSASGEPAEVTTVYECATYSKPGLLSKEGVKEAAVFATAEEAFNDTRS